MALLKTAQCSSCGAKVVFRASASLITVCEYCKTTLIRQDLNVAALGKMADLLEDHSPLQINTQGRYKGGNFTIVGRVQYSYKDGVWNEWHIVFANGKSGWLSEASGSYVISFPFLNHQLNQPANLYMINEPAMIAGQQYRVTNIAQVKCVAGQGELPFQISVGEEFTSIDLTSQHGYASIDFSEDKPQLFVGEQVELPLLGLSGLRELDLTETKYKVRSFNCPHCASPIEVQLSSTRSLVCASCTSIIGLENNQVALITKVQEKLTIKPRLSLGSIGKFEGKAFRIIGFMRRKTTGLYLSEWDEYLLHHPIHGFRWLTDAQGHWNFVTPLQKTPVISRSSISRTPEIFLYKTYKHFEKYSAKVTFVLGEFYWRVKLDDIATINDYIAPPSILTSEMTGKETSWSQGEYLEPREIESAFDLHFSLPVSSRLGANQPSPYEPQVLPFIKAYAFFMVMAVFIQIIYLSTNSEHALYSTNVTFNRQEADPAFQSEAFNIDGRIGNVMIRQQSNVNNDWVATSVSLVDKNTGQHYEANQELSYYSGYDEDGSWSEGNSEGEILFSDIPAGTYYLDIHAELDRFLNNNDITDRILVYRNVPLWGNLWLSFALLTTIPAIFYYLRSRFEIKRWEDSDHPIVKE